MLHTYISTYLCLSSIIIIINHLLPFSSPPPPPFARVCASWIWPTAFCLLELVDRRCEEDSDLMTRFRSMDGLLFPPSLPNTIRIRVMWCLKGYIHTYICIYLFFANQKKKRKKRKNRQKKILQHPNDVISSPIIIVRMIFSFFLIMTNTFPRLRFCV